MNDHPSDAELFEAFVALRFDALTLARQRGIPILAILDWFESAPVQEALARLDRMTDRALELCARVARVTALNTLGDAAIVAETPVELRRASTTLSTHTRPPRTTLPPHNGAPPSLRSSDPAPPSDDQPAPYNDELSTPIQPVEPPSASSQRSPAALLHASAGLAAPDPTSRDSPLDEPSRSPASSRYTQVGC